MIKLYSLICLLFLSAAAAKKVDYCARCESWYRQELQDTDWLKQLNAHIKCPCRARKKFLALDAARGTSNLAWSPDMGCRFAGFPYCDYYHPGAYGCIRSDDVTSTGAGQQCCYDKNLAWIPSGTLGAGTPDRAVSSVWNMFRKHKKLDVEPFEWCCKKCRKASHCKFYYDGVRRGSDTCTKTSS